MRITSKGQVTIPIMVIQLTPPNATNSRKGPACEFICTGNIRGMAKIGR